MAAEHRKQLELALINQKKEIESCTIPFLQELIGGEDGGTHVATSATEKVSHSPHGPKVNMNAPIEDMSIPHMENIPVEAKEEGELESNNHTEKTSDKTNGEVEPTTSPSDQPLEKGLARKKQHPALADLEPLKIENNSSGTEAAAPLQYLREPRQGSLREHQSECSTSYLSERVMAPMLQHLFNFSPMLQDFLTRMRNMTCALHPLRRHRAHLHRQSSAEECCKFQQLQRNS
ncbi:hypothetical protein SUGI_0967170 [Cryptomeria japonica]|nr:hypothetical protein SUGI_0967170 [Cryptomeria japonica]